MTMIGATQHSYDQRGDNLYETRPEAVDALLDQVWPPLPKNIWEPACGPGVIVKELRRAGYNVLASDIVDYGDRRCPDSQHGVDFLKVQELPPGIEAIVTNPPYQGKLPADFVRHAIKLGVPRIVFLLRLNFLASTGRSDILEGSGFFRANVFRNRLPMMHRDGYEGKKSSSAVEYGWFDWHPGTYRGDPTLSRISWKERVA